MKNEEVLLQIILFSSSFSSFIKVENKVILSLFQNRRNFLLRSLKKRIEKLEKQTARLYGEMYIFVPYKSHKKMKKLTACVFVLNNEKIPVSENKMEK